MESHHFFQSILSYLHLHPLTGDWFAFLVSFTESLPLIGTVVPGTITMTIVGVLMGNGTLPFWRTLLILSAAAFMGDCLGYVIGYYYNERLRTMWPFKNHPKWLAMGEAFFAKHGGKSILIGRFFGPARSTVPLIAGLLQLTWQRFLFAAIPSAFLWALMYVTPGLLLGALARELPRAETTRFFIYGIGTIIVISCCIWLIQYFFTQLTRAIDQFTDRCWRSLTQENMGKYIIRHIANEQNPEDHRPLLMLFLATFTGLLFLFLFINVRLHTTLIAINYPAFHLLQSIRTAPLDHLFAAITVIGSPICMLVSGLLLSAGFILYKQYRAAIHLTAVTILTAGAVFTFKHLSHSPRPQGFDFVAHSSSFPSGHTTMTTAILFFIAFLYTQITPRNARPILYALAGITTMLVAFSRLYLGAHWLCDIIGSLLLATTILLLCVISYRRMPSTSGILQLPATKGTLLLCFSFALPILFFMQHDFTKTVQHATPIWQRTTISMETWWKNPLKSTPRYRNNRFGDPIQPLNVQWASPLSLIEKSLALQGWQTVQDQSQLKATLARLGSRDAQYHMPILPWLYRQRPPVLVMIKHIPLHKRIIELRLWQSELHFSENNIPLWIGATDIRIPPKELISLKEHATITLAGNGGLTELFDDTGDFQRQYRHAQDQNTPKQIQKLQWNGKILLLRVP